MSAVVLIAALCGFAIGMTYPSWKNDEPVDTYGEVRENSKAFHFINPLLECDLGSAYLKGNAAPNQQKLLQMIDDAKNKGLTTFVSLYYRDLNNGPWFGINEKEKFFPASLMKIPLMFQYYKEAGDDPSVLNQTIVFDRSKRISTIQHYPSLVELEDKKAYTIEQLIEYALRYSNNDAATLLFERATPGHLAQLFADLKITLPEDNKGEDYITARSYATFFRVLYNSSYLTNERSEHALDLLSRSSFTHGLTAKLPAGVVVAHKFGERVIDDTQAKQLHDCGIVYASTKPYLLCIMTRGKDLDELANLIADLSQQVYGDVTGHASDFTLVQP